jgi:transcriptional regulator with XRE-family HTH domain
MSRQLSLAKFGLKIRQCRKQIGLSQEELANKTEIHRTYIGGIERGERNPTLLMILRLAQALQVRPQQLLEEPEERNHES